MSVTSEYRVYALVKLVVFFVVLFLLKPCFSVDSSDSRKDSLLQKLSIGNDKWKMSLFPILGIDPSSGLECGVSSFFVFFSDSLGKTSTVLPSFFYSTNNWIDAEIDIALYKKKWVYKCNTEFNKTPELVILPLHSFYADVKSMHFSANVVHQFFDNSFFEIGLNFNSCSVDTIMQTDVIALGSDKIVGAQLGYVFDSREHNLYPVYGNYIDLSLLPCISLSDYSLGTTAWVDARHFYCYNQRTIVALQYYSQHASKNTMYLQMPRLAGATRMRGFSNRNKYVNYNIAYVQAELRRHLWWQFGAVVFCGAGNAGYTIGEMFSLPLFSYGAGLRFEPIKKSRLHLRSDFACTSSGDFVFYFGVSEAF